MTRERRQLTAEDVWGTAWGLPMELLPPRHSVVGYYDGHRYWRAPNVIPIERYQSRAEQDAVLDRMRSRGR
jgi:hypothetical protein